ncbi:DUF6265 family protein [Parapedobacter koreensis]|uniref:DUF6265 domain-containing protein n=1 Tax=Parapedobacter koreensis TaxID=332977 RepID=A0A1H7T748_9SPHI|nr:DUF6265 family protein [Parapedobacter koreensis]SEL79617.1 hypothetical protein SAMN05421740_11079 [Parapedobacter koreensis]
MLAVVGLIICCGWTERQIDEIKKAEWLFGTWENKMPKGSLYETWSQLNDGEFLGKSYFLNDGDTILFETVRLLEKEQKLYYIVSVANQNDGLPVSFASTAVTDNVLIFENPQHDFPQVITYTKINADSLVAEISGMANGQERKQLFPMKRIR